MDEYMAAADLLVGKPSGLTSSEALASGLALVIRGGVPLADCPAIPPARSRCGVRGRVLEASAV
jgi:hypothetical protein